MLLLLAAAAIGGAVYVIAVSRIAPNPVGQSLLTAVVCLTFVGAGVAALRLRPYARFGLLLAAVGFASLISVLHEANGAGAYTVGVFASNLVFAVLVHALLAYPSGRLRTTGERCIVVAAYLDVVALQALAVIFDPLTRYHSDHPRNLALVDSQSALATGLYELEAAASATAGACRGCVHGAPGPGGHAGCPPSAAAGGVGGTVALLLFSLGLVLAPLSSRAGLLGFRARPDRRARAARRLSRDTRPGTSLACGRRRAAARASRSGAPGRSRGGARARARRPDARLGRLASDGGYLDGSGARAGAPRAGRPPRHDADPASGRAGRHARARPLAAAPPGAARRRQRRGRLRACERACAPRCGESRSRETAPCSTRSPTRSSAMAATARTSTFGRTR